MSDISSDEFLDGIKMNLRSKKDRDPATRKLEDDGLLNFRKKNRRGNAARKIKEFGKISYDFWSGVKYIVVLSALLWWIPLFGPMLAGYVGGRRTGGPKKGILASIVSLGIIGAIYYALTQGYIYITFERLVEYPEQLMAIATSHSVLGPYFEFLRLYWTAFFNEVLAGVPFGTNSYILTVIFAYIGGIISYEKRKEVTNGVRSLDKVKKEISDLHKSAKNPTSRTSSKKAKSASNTGRSLNDLKAVRYQDKKRHNGSKDKEKRRPKRRKPSPKSNDRFDNTPVQRKDEQAGFEDERSMPKSDVRHHSTSNGDDWEFL